MQEFANEEFKSKFDTYPKEAKTKLLTLRSLLYEVASKEQITDISECLKWNEPSFICKGGSTIRIDWKKKHPEYYSIYFNCKTKLIPTFKELFSDKLTFKGNREIVLNLEDKLDKKLIKYCFLLALTYKKRKHLFLLDE